MTVRTGAPPPAAVAAVTVFVDGARALDAIVADGAADALAGASATVEAGVLAVGTAEADGATALVDPATELAGGAAIALGALSDKDGSEADLCAAGEGSGFAASSLLHADTSATRARSGSAFDMRGLIPRPVARGNQEPNDRSTPWLRRCGSESSRPDRAGPARRARQ